MQEISLDRLLARYDALLLDAYGVLVHLSGALPGAGELIAKLNQQGKPYCILTNDASKLPAIGAARYRGFGLDIAVEQLVTSGMLLQAYFAEYGLYRARCVVLGTPDSVRYVELAGGEVTHADQDFDVLVVADQTGYALLDTVDTVITTLFQRVDRGLSVHLVLPNPDLIYLKGQNAFGLASGSVALLIESALALRYPKRQDLRFARLGKPGPRLFEEGLRRCATRNALMIGDQLETDMRGARACGIDCALITSGVSAPELDHLPDSVRPDYLLRSLAFERAGAG